MTGEYLFTSESVTEGHPDKVCDQISDAILDSILEQDPNARVAANTVCSAGLVLLTGQITTTATSDYPQIARSTLQEIGYNNTELGMDYKGCAVLMNFEKQSPDIAQGVDQAQDDPLDQGAGDQGMMFGYAVDETTELMPMPIALAHQLVQQQAKLRRSGHFDWIRPDGKSQVTLRYKDNKPVAIETVIISTQHSPDVSLEKLREAIIEECIKPILPPDLSKENIRYLVNPTGRFITGGPQGDTGLTGKKLMVDTYGSSAPHGGGAFSGKDPSKVDRSATYAARYVAKNVVAAGLAKRCLLQVSYSIGVAQPTSLMVETFGTGILSDDKLGEMLARVFDWRPKMIIQKLDLLKPIYRQTAKYGHFGRKDVNFSWEALDLAEALKAIA
ncbi:methionine adenosyltransferase [Polynucleobacter sp. AP-Reno-20A-A9]|uniref:methionine adenosyltransferase n=1 Tax=Polynucleobacter sp. AP-Reno-20A-A9 TaxID=2576925 RepID=UPI001C0AF0CA|nr:methionine adenosyltransferase [Polynucleobacter sp. AP-Reno-20A-A9]MBU3629098.1 methionine adenosyltransferase [Polynucleobacter sp. AP-Reno-20A-A9]